MAQWQHLSKFAAFLDVHPKFFSPHSAVMPLDDQAQVVAIHALRQLSARLPSVHPLASKAYEILDFAEDFQLSSKSMQTERIFEKLQPLRSWLFWMPVSLVKANDMSSSAMVLLAQLYTLALAIDSSIPELSGAALGTLGLQAIEQLDTKLSSKLAMAVSGEMSTADLSRLMEYPRLTVTHNRLEEALSNETRSIGAKGQDNSYCFHRLSVGSQPSTPNYPPPGSPGMLIPWHNISSEELSIPPSPFLHYGGHVSRRHSAFLETSSLASDHSFDHSFDNRSLSAFDAHGDSPAYSPAAFSPTFLPEIPDDGWTFDMNEPGFDANHQGIDLNQQGFTGGYGFPKSSYVSDAADELLAIPFSTNSWKRTNDSMCAIVATQ